MNRTFVAALAATLIAPAAYGQSSANRPENPGGNGNGAAPW